MKPKSFLRQPIAPPAVADLNAVLASTLGEGIEDLSGARYDDVEGLGNRSAHALAQFQQADYLLSQVRCDKESVVLQIGCGNGRILKQAERRGARAVGISTDRNQVRHCREIGLDARFIDYRRLHPSRVGRFSGIIASGAIEHLVQPRDALAGRTDEIYANFFKICRRLITRGDRLATTAIHFQSRNQVRPEHMMGGAQFHDPDSPSYHFASILQDCFGGWYPVPRQLQAAARGTFILEQEEDATADYARAAERWLSQLKWSMATRPAVMLAVARRFRQRFHATLQSLRCLLIDQSWNWQFRGTEPPTSVLRHTWRAV